MVLSGLLVMRQGWMMTTRDICATPNSGGEQVNF